MSRFVFRVVIWQLTQLQVAQRMFAGRRMMCKDKYQVIHVDKIPAGLRIFRPIPQKERFRLDSAGPCESLDEICLFERATLTNKENLNGQITVPDSTLNQSECLCFLRSAYWHHGNLFILDLQENCASKSCIVKRTANILLRHDPTDALQVQFSSLCDTHSFFSPGFFGKSGPLEYVATLANSGLLPRSMIIDTPCCTNHWTLEECNAWGMDRPKSSNSVTTCSRKHIRTVLGFAGHTEERITFSAENVQGNKLLYNGMKYDIVGNIYKPIVQSRTVTYDEICKWSLKLLPLCVAYQSAQFMAWSHDVAQLRGVFARRSFTYYPKTPYSSARELPLSEQLCRLYAGNLSHIQFQNIVACWPRQAVVLESSPLLDARERPTPVWQSILGNNSRQSAPENDADTGIDGFFEIPCLEYIQPECRFYVKSVSVLISSDIKQGIIAGLQVFGVGIRSVSLVLETLRTNPSTGSRSYYTIPFDRDAAGVWTYPVPLIRTLFSFYFSTISVNIDLEDVTSVTSPLDATHRFSRRTENIHRRTYSAGDVFGMLHMDDVADLETIRKVAEHIFEGCVARNWTIGEGSLTNIHHLLERGFLPDLFDKYDHSTHHICDEIVGKKFGYYDALDLVNRDINASSSEDENGSDIVREYRIRDQETDEVDLFFNTREPEVDMPFFDALLASSGPHACPAYNRLYNLKFDESVMGSGKGAKELDHFGEHIRHTYCTCTRCEKDGCTWPHVCKLQYLCDAHKRELLPTDLPWAILSWTDVGQVSSDVFRLPSANFLESKLVVSVFGNEWIVQEGHVEMS